MTSCALLVAAWQVAGRPVADRPGVEVASRAVGPSEPLRKPPAAAPSSGSRLSSSPSPDRSLGPGLSTPGIVLTVSTDEAGVLDAVERLRFAGPVHRLVLTPPATERLAGTVWARPTIRDLQATADGSVVAPEGAGATGALGPIVFRMAQPAQVFVLRYRVEGAVARSHPAPPGRSLARVRPLAAGALPGEPVVVRFVGEDVTNLSCPLLPQARQLCGQQERGAWSSRSLTGVTAVVIAQLNLPAPS